MHPSGEDINSSYSPSFSSYFNTNLADVVARVTTEFASADDDDFFSNNGNRNENADGIKTGCKNEHDDDFEFNLSDFVPVGGEIRPVYPVFDRDLLPDFDLVGEFESRPSDHEEKLTGAQMQLKNLFIEDRDDIHPSSPSASSSSSDSDELEGIPPGTYCVWAPNKSPSSSPSPGRCTKSNSTGSSASSMSSSSVAEKPKAWKLRDLLKRSRSDGKHEGRLMLLTPKKKVDTPAGRDSICFVASASAAAAGGKTVRKTAAKTTALERYLVEKSREGGDKKERRTYLPYRRDLVGLFASPRAVRRVHLPSF